MTDAAPLATERDYQRTIVGHARIAGWLVHHCRPAPSRKGWRTPIQGDAGFPDLVLVHPKGRAMFVELKRRDNPGASIERLPTEQDSWRTALAAAGIIWRLVVVPDEMDDFCRELYQLPSAPTGVSR